jgi:formate dehydrogenase
MIAIGKDRSIKDVTANLMAFFEHESCGECAPCRIGTVRSRQALDGSRQITGSLTDVLKSVCKTMKDGSRCGLGQSAPNALLDALRLFPEEF